MIPNRRRSDLIEARSKRSSRRTWMKVVVFSFLGFYVYALWWCVTNSHFLSKNPAGLRSFPFRQESSPLVGSKSPNFTLVMDSNHFPYPYLSKEVSSSSIPIVVQCRGELGNHLSTIAHGIGLQLAALEDFNRSTHMFLRHQTLVDQKSGGVVVDNPKWLTTSHVLKRCFPAMRDWDFSLGSQWAEFDRLFVLQQQQQQHAQFANEESTQLILKMSLVNGRVMSGKSGINNVKEPVTAPDLKLGLAAIDELWQHLGSNNVSSSSLLLNSPFLYSESMDNMVLLKRYLPIFRILFRMNPSCCGSLRPDPYESVFHYRNFAREFQQSVGTKDGHQPSTLPSFEEATPHQTAHVLFSHLKTGDKVAITSRFANDPFLINYVKALEERGIKVRIVLGQREDVEDFCFLQQARALVGNFRSTFVFWAALLGNAENVLLYTIKSPGLKSRFGPFIKMFFTGNTTWHLRQDFGTSSSTGFQKLLRMVLLPMDTIRR